MENQSVNIQESAENRQTENMSLQTFRVRTQRGDQLLFDKDQLLISVNIVTVYRKNIYQSLLQDHMYGSDVIPVKHEGGQELQKYLLLQFPKLNSGKLGYLY